MNQKSYKSAIDKIKISKESKDKAKLLYQTFNSDTEVNNIMDIKTVSRKRRIGKPVSIIAASLAVVMALGAFMNFSFFTDKNSSNNMMFTVNAAELKTDSNTAVIDEKYSGLSIGEDDNYYDTYCAYTPLKCEGNNIDTITYTVNRGALEVAVKDTKLIRDYDKKNPAVNAPSIGSEKSTFIQSSSFTFDYENQDKDICMSVIGDSTSLSADDQKYLKAHKEQLYFLDDKVSIEDEKKAQDILIKDTVITATVKFNDGTTKTQDIKMGTEIIKASKAFASEEVPTGKDDTIVAIAYKLV